MRTFEIGDNIAAIIGLVVLFIGFGHCQKGEVDALRIKNKELKTRLEKCEGRDSLKIER